MNNSTKNSISKSDVHDIFNNASETGMITPQSANLIIGNMGELVVQGANGIDTDDIESSDVTLVTIIIDRSQSMGHLKDAVTESYKSMINSFIGSKQSDDIMVSLWIYGSDVSLVHSYTPVNDIDVNDTSWYQIGGMTALHDAWFNAVSSNVAYAQQLRDSGTPCKSIVVIATDGQENASRQVDAGKCKQLSHDLLKSEQFILAFVGIGPDEDEYKAEAENIGIPDGCIMIETDVNPSNLRRIFQVISQSAIKASQGQIIPGSSAGFFQ